MQTSPVSKFYGCVAGLHLPQPQQLRLHPAAYSCGCTPENMNQTFLEQTSLYPLRGRLKNVEEG